MRQIPGRALGPGGMYVDPQDNRPPSLLGHRTPDPVALIGGLAVAVGAHVLFAGALLLMGLIFGTEVLAREEPPEPEQPTEVRFVQAKLVKLGRQFDPRELPNRRREARTTAPRRDRTPTEHSKRVRAPDAGVEPEVAVEDMLARLGTRADEMARLARAAEQEGDPGGVEEGTATREEGDVYISQLYSFFRRGFQFESGSYTNEELRGMRVVARIQISPDGRVADYTIRSSGTPEFDHAVRIRLDQARGARIPEPPEERRDEFYGNTIPISFVPPRH